MGWGPVAALLAVGCGASPASDVVTVEIEPTPGSAVDASEWSSRCPRGVEQLPRPAQSPTEQQLAKARNEMRMGVSMLGDFGDKHEDAFDFFANAYALSGSLNALQNAGLCADNLELYGFAIDAYERVIAGEGAQGEPSVRQRIEADLARIRKLTTVVELSTTTPLVRVVDTRLPRRGDPIVRSYELRADCDKRLRVRSGNHELVANAEGASEQRWRVELQPGQVVEHSFDLE